MGAKSGYNFETEIDSALFWYSVHQYPLFHLKLPDTHAWSKAVTFIKTMFQMIPPHMKEKFHGAMDAYAKFTLPKQPGDFLVIYKSIGMIIECKSSKQNVLDPWWMVSEHQKIYADCITIMGEGLYYFVLCNRQKPGFHYLITLRSTSYNDLRIWMIANGMRSITWEHLIAFSQNVDKNPISFISAQKKPRGGRAVIKWDLTPIFIDAEKWYDDICKGRENP